MNSRMTRRGFIRGLAAGGVALCGCGGSAIKRNGGRAKAVKRPNILFIMADDHASNAISCYGSHLAGVAKTENIDRIGEQGMRLENCFCTNSLCSPSRASILTGQYSHINGVYTTMNRLDSGHQTVAGLLRESGYRTAIIGKWHLKSEPSGFDYWNILPGQGSYHNPVMKEKGTGEQKYEGFCTDVITELSLKWLNDVDLEQPFFLMTQFKNSHEPWHYAERHSELYRDTDIPEPPSLWEELSHRSSGSREYGYTMDSMAYRLAGISRGKWPTKELDISGMNERQRKRWAYQRFLKDYLRCVKAIDENVGRLLDYLDSRGLADDTIVIYTSDQGYFLGEHGYIDKRWMFEESLRMPFLIRYPREIEAGGSNDDIILNIDFAPSFLDFACFSIPESMQGRSFRSNLAGRTPGDWRGSMYYRYWWHGKGASRPAHYGIRTKRYKFIFYYGLPLDIKWGSSKPTKPGCELYDLARDPYEMDNVYRDPEYSGVVKKMKKELLRLKRKYNDTDDKYPQLLKLRRQCRWE